LSSLSDNNSLLNKIIASKTIRQQWRI